MSVETGNFEDHSQFNDIALKLSQLGLTSATDTSANNGIATPLFGLPYEDAKLRGNQSKNMTECVAVPSSEHVAEIVGRQGCKIKALRAKTNTYIKTPVRGEDPVFIVTGRKEDVILAKKEILAAAEHFSQIRASRRHSNGTNGSVPSIPGQVTIQVRVPYRVVGLVVGPKGSTIKRIQQDSHTYIVTPSRDKDPVFEVTGLPDNVDKAKHEIEAHIAMRTGAGLVEAIPDEKSDFHCNGVDVDLPVSIAAAEFVSPSPSLPNGTTFHPTLTKSHNGSNGHSPYFEPATPNLSGFQEFVPPTNGHAKLDLPLIGNGLYDATDEGIGSPSYDSHPLSAGLPGFDHQFSNGFRTMCNKDLPQRSNSICSGDLAFNMADRASLRTSPTTMADLALGGDPSAVRRFQATVADPVKAASLTAETNSHFCPLMPEDLLYHTNHRNAAPKQSKGSSGTNGIPSTTSQDSAVSTSPTDSVGSIGSNGSNSGSEIRSMLGHRLHLLTSEEPRLTLNGSPPPLVKSSHRCLICNDRDVVAVLVPCGHSRFCFECANQMASTPAANCSSGDSSLALEQDHAPCVEKQRGLCPLCQTKVTQAVRLIR